MLLFEENLTLGDHVTSQIVRSVGVTDICLCKVNKNHSFALSVVYVSNYPSVSIRRILGL